MLTATELRIRYAELSWDYEFPEYVEDALEADFISNPEMYSESTMKSILALLLIDPNPEISDLLSLVRKNKI
jgi:hypothetical protein